MSSRAFVVLLSFLFVPITACSGPPESESTGPGTTPVAKEEAEAPAEEREAAPPATDARPMVRTGGSADFYLGGGRGIADRDDGAGGDRYAAIEEGGFVATAANRLSTFAADVDTASWTNVRRYLAEGRLPPEGAVRIEGLLNAVEYSDPVPTGRDPFAVTTELGPCPWQPRHHLLRVGLRTRPIDNDKVPPCNLVFLLDVSGSMGSPDKLPLLVRAMDLLVDQLRPQDRVAIVTYAGRESVALESTPGDCKAAIRECLQTLRSGGSTAGEGGIRKAYEIARRHRIPEGINRVILGTDGDFNVGTSDVGELKELIAGQSADGIFLSVLGFGHGNLRDDVMEGLANRGNGHYAYVDGLHEARRVLVEEFGATLVTVAKDVKIQLEFDGRFVAGYRLLGYENRVMKAEEFRDDDKDAGEMGAGHHVTVLYEIVPAGEPVPGAEEEGADAEAASLPADPRLAVLRLRYEPPLGDTARELTFEVAAPRPGDVDSASSDLHLATAIAAFGMQLRGSGHRGALQWPLTVELAQASGHAELWKMAQRAAALHTGDDATPVATPR